MLSQFLSMYLHNLFRMLLQSPRICIIQRNDYSVSYKHNYSLELPFGRMSILQGLECQEFILLSDKECEYILPTFDHVSPPSRDGQSSIFRYQMKDINRE